MALAHTGISVELREILLSERPDELYAISSKGTVPVLELEDGPVSYTHLTLPTKA